MVVELLTPFGVIVHAIKLTAAAVLSGVRYWVSSRFVLFIWHKIAAEWPKTTTRGVRRTLDRTQALKTSRDGGKIAPSGKWS